jgi:hypothetical protein
MYELMTGLPPYHDISHDENLVMKICKGLRPRFTIKIPQLIVNLIKNYLDANSLNRPTAEKINSIMYQWDRILKNQEFHTELYKQIKEADEFNNNNLPSNSIPSTTNLGLPYKTHSGAIYTSRSFNFSNLPVPKNSYD